MIFQNEEALGLIEIMNAGCKVDKATLSFQLFKESAIK